MHRRGPGGGGGGNAFSTNIQVGPSQYVPKINTAGMLDVNYQQGRFNLDGDALYLNTSTTATIQGSVIGPRGKLQIPITINSSARLATSIWQVAAGYTLAQGHQADLIMFAGIREFPISVTADYNTIVGNRRFVGPSGTVDTSDNASDAIWGIQRQGFLRQRPLGRSLLLRRRPRDEQSVVAGVRRSRLRLQPRAIDSGVYGVR